MNALNYFVIYFYKKSNFTGRSF